MVCNYCQYLKKRDGSQISLSVYSKDGVDFATLGLTQVLKLGIAFFIKVNLVVADTSTEG